MGAASASASASAPAPASAPVSQQALLATPAAVSTDPPVLAIERLHVAIGDRGGVVAAGWPGWRKGAREDRGNGRRDGRRGGRFDGHPRLVLRGVDLSIGPGEIHALVGESGAGKSMIARTVLGILPPAARVAEGAVRLLGLDWLALPEAARRERLGCEVALVPQDPLTALDPAQTIGRQLAEPLRLHRRPSAEALRARLLELLEAVRIRDPQRVLRAYPHELSGGMRQRVLIAMAFSCRPRLVVADEPTTALDVTVQREILRLLRALQREEGAAVLFVTHDLGVVAKIADRVSVLHAGRVLEHGPTAQVFAVPRSPYTRALMEATPRHDRPAEALRPVEPALLRALEAEAAAYDLAWQQERR